ncbi:hypothetical protein ACFQ3K_08965 [Brucella gallinifaecis]|uniref:Uncharacterized protein n=1 Tax=Brucella gallinifaecis TaxID=215590 RepID=A0A502BPJ0_9HYPH|nr:hypothetical protein [Brucella gallinifaecis]TPF75561.1 hypothetical protein FHY56_09940 [Brucella gallinifaecis]
MFRFILRSLAVMCLALAVIFAILDAARFVGASEIVTKPLLDIWAQGAPELLGDAEAFVTYYIGGAAWNSLFLPVLDQPAWLILGVLALLFYLAGFRREKRFGNFSA